MAASPQQQQQRAQSPQSSGRLSSKSPRSADSQQPASKSSYSGDFWTFFFNGKSAIAEALRKDPKLIGNTPAWVLGRFTEDADPDHITHWVNVNVKHIHYFSYRNRFPEALDGGLDHDAGWGCMIRTGQMMLCEALRRCLPNDEIARNTHLLFRDLKSAPFGIHRMTEEGAKAHIPVGQWFSPTALAFSIKRLVAQTPLTAPHVAVVIGMDGAVKRDDISAEFVEGRPVIVMVPIMAGREKVPADAQRAILKMFELPCTLGIVGGRPKHSLYFVGTQNGNVFFLDPHTVQPAFVSKETVGNASGVRGTMNVADMDPSMVLCFLLAKKHDLDEWERAFATVINKMTEYPLFSIVRSKPKAAAAASPTRPQPAPAGATSSAAAAPPPQAQPAAAAAAVATPPPGGDEFDDCDYDDDVEAEMDSLGPSKRQASS